MAVTLKMRILVFSEFRPYLRILSAFNIDNFCGKDLSLIGKHILLVFWLLILVISMISVAVLSYWNCVDTGLTMDKLGFTLPIVLSIVQTLLTHMSLSLNNCLISEAIEFLQFAVDERKFFFKFFLFKAWVYLVYLFSSQGRPLVTIY